MFMCVYEHVRDAVGKHGRFHRLAFGWGLAVLESSRRYNSQRGDAVLQREAEAVWQHKSRRRGAVLQCEAEAARQHNSRGKKVSAVSSIHVCVCACVCVCVCVSVCACVCVFV